MNTSVFCRNSITVPSIQAIQNFLLHFRVFLRENFRLFCPLSVLFIRLLLLELSFVETVSGTILSSNIYVSQAVSQQSLCLPSNLYVIPAISMSSQQSRCLLSNLRVFPAISMSFPAISMSSLQSLSSQQYLFLPSSRYVFQAASVFQEVFVSSQQSLFHPRGKTQRRNEQMQFLVIML